MYTTEELIDPYAKPTQDTYDGFQLAYEHYNLSLFEGRLPNALITLQRSRRSYGYFCFNRFERDDGKYCDEIAMNPRYFRERSLEDVVSTLVHEMVHLWQFHFGAPGRGRYHNREWAEKMKTIGLYPSNTGAPGGQELGDQMSHYIIDGGPFAISTERLITQGFKIDWQDKPVKPIGPPTDPEAPPMSKPSKAGKRVKYACPACGLNAWAKHEARLMCAVDQKIMDAQI